MKKEIKKWSITSANVLSSMSFAIVLLIILAVVSVIGTFIKQKEQYEYYINQFGPILANIFNKLGFFSVYTAWWYIFILCFLGLSILLCMIRNIPKIFKNHSLNHNIRYFPEIEKSKLLQNYFELKMNFFDLQSFSMRVSDFFKKKNYKVISQFSQNEVKIFAKKGISGKYGYTFVHSAVLLICLGGFLDSDLFINILMRFNGNVNYSESKSEKFISDVSKKYKLPSSNYTYNSYLLLSEGSNSKEAIARIDNNIYTQELPFSILLKKFHIHYYSTGMPSSFLSDILIQDIQTGKKIEGQISVNKPFHYHGTTIYQSSFEDGGSLLKFKVYPMIDKVYFKDHFVTGRVGQVLSQIKIRNFSDQYTVYFNNFRPINIEDTSGISSEKNFKNIKKYKNLLKYFSGSSNSVKKKKNFKNIGPSVHYTLINNVTGESLECNNYQQPLLIDDNLTFMFGIRNKSTEEFKYIRIPADENNSIEEWFALNKLFRNPKARKLAAKKFSNQINYQKNSTNQILHKQLEQSAIHLIELFAGKQYQSKDSLYNQSLSGLYAISDFIEKSIPLNEQERFSEITFKILYGVIWELWQKSREQLNLPLAKIDEKNKKFAQQAILALSESAFYSAPLLLHLEEFEEKKASVFQIVKTPGKKIVYFGFLLLVVGIFAMFYLYDRRIWIKILDNGQIIYSMFATRKTLMIQKEFDSYKEKLHQMHQEDSINKLN